VDEYSLLLDLITDQDGATTLADKNWQQKLFMFHHYDIHFQLFQYG
jgi:hypothetical protein